MAENKDYITHPEEKGTINVSEEVIAALAASAAKEIDGVDGLSGTKTEDWARLLGKKGMAKGVKVQLSGTNINLDVYIIVKLNYQINEVALKVQEAVVSAVESTTGFGVATANVHVSGIAVK